MENNGDDRAVGVAEGNAEDEYGADFSTIPQSNNQTSPRLGGTFLLDMPGGQLISSGGGHLVA